MFHLVRSRLVFRLAAVFIFGSVLPIVGAGILTLRLLERSVREDALHRHEVLADLGGSLVRDFIQRGKEKLMTVSRLLDRELTERNVGDWTASNDTYRATVLERLNHLIEPPDMYLELQYYAGGKEPLFVCEAGQQEYQTLQKLEPEYEQRKKQQRDVNAQGSLVREPLCSNRSYVNLQPERNWGFSTLPLSVPVASGKRMSGVVVAYLDFRRVNGILGTMAQGGYHVRLADGKGSILAEAGAALTEMVGVKRAVGYSDWTIEVQEPASHVYAAVGEVRRQALLWIGLALLLAVGLSVGFSAWIVRPISALTRAAQAMGAGNFTVRAGIHRDDEIGRLGAAFDRMAVAVEKLDEAKSDFISNASHELRTPMTAIRLAIANLLDGVVGPLDDRQQATLQRLRGDVDRMIHLVNGLLELACLEAGAEVPRREKLDLLALARECVANLDPLAREKFISMEVLGEGTVEADRGMVHRVITNLLDNAVKFTPVRGRVTVTVSGPEVRVADTGPGMTVDRPFEKFSQGKQEGVKNKGVGLGLAIVKKLVDLQGGSIRVENNNGAVFIVNL